MSGLDIIKALKKENGLERSELFKRVNHLVNRGTFTKNIASLLKSNDIVKVERIKYIYGARKLIVRFHLLD